MHLYLLTRGIKHDVDRFINDLQAQYFPYNEDKKTFVQLAVRPMQLWEIVYPKDSFPEVIKMVAPAPEYNPKMYNYAQLAVLRRILKAKKIPFMDLSKTPQRIVYKGFCATYPIGVRDDGKWADDAGEFAGGELL